MMAAQMGSAPREQFLAVSRQGLAVQSITPDGQAQVMAWMEASDQATVATALGEVMSADFSPVLENVDVPVSVLFAWSEGMPMSAEALESVYQGQYAPLDRVAFHRIDGSRHFIMLDRAEAFRAVLSGVIAGEED
jgi:pimeloyl-ACP methyl ester carboxylesterase